MSDDLREIEKENHENINSDSLSTKSKDLSEKRLVRSCVRRRTLSNERRRITSLDSLLLQESFVDRM